MNDNTKLPTLIVRGFPTTVTCAWCDNPVPQPEDEHAVTYCCAGCEDADRADGDLVGRDYDGYYAPSSDRGILRDEFHV